MLHIRASCAARLGVPDPLSFLLARWGEADRPLGVLGAPLADLYRCHPQQMMQRIYVDVVSCRVLVTGCMSSSKCCWLGGRVRSGTGAGSLCYRCMRSGGAPLLLNAVDVKPLVVQFWYPNGCQTVNTLSHCSEAD